MNKEELLMYNAKETLEIINKGIEKLNSIMEEITRYGYKYDLELEDIDCSTVSSKKQYHRLNAILTKDLSTVKENEE